MIEIPPGVVANWPAPDLAHPETKGPALPIIVFLLYFLTAFALGFRIWGRIKASQRLCIEDSLVIIAMVRFIFRKLQKPGLCSTHTTEQIPTTGVSIAVLLSK